MLPETRAGNVSRVVKALAIIGVCTVVASVVAALFLGLGLHGGFSARDAPSRLERVVAGFLRRAAVPTRFRKMQNPVSSSPAVLAAAQVHWADHCAGCHAVDGSGDTEIGRGLYPRPPDLRAAETQTQSDGELYATIENGVRLTGMPAWGPGGERDEKTWALVLFTRRLPFLSAAEIKVLKSLVPKTPGETRELQDEEAFLNGTTSE